jgi:hypothetical protein
VPLPSSCWAAAWAAKLLLLLLLLLIHLHVLLVFSSTAAAATVFVHSSSALIERLACNLADALLSLVMRQRGIQLL